MPIKYASSGIRIDANEASHRKSIAPMLLDKDELIATIFEVQHSMALEGQAISESDLYTFIDESLIRHFVQSQQLP